MANFCTKCGKKLENKEKCTCEKVKEKEVVNNIDIISIISNFLSKPIDTLKTNISKENSYILLGLSSLVIGLVSTLFYHNIFIYKTLESFILFIVFAFIISMLSNIIFKKTDTFNDTLELVSKSSIIIMIGGLISFIFAFFSIEIGIVFIIATIILFLLYTYHGLLLKLDIDQNKIAYLLAISIFIIAIIKLILLKTI